MARGIQEGDDDGKLSRSCAHTDVQITITTTTFFTTGSLAFHNHLGRCLRYLQVIGFSNHGHEKTGPEKLLGIY